MLAKYSLPEPQCIEDFGPKRGEGGGIPDAPGKRRDAPLPSGLSHESGILEIRARFSGEPPQRNNVRAERRAVHMFANRCDRFPKRCANSHKCSTWNIRLGAADLGNTLAQRRATCALNYCPIVSTASSTSHAKPMVCQYQAVASTVICRNSTRLNRFTAVRHTISAPRPTTRWAACSPVMI